MTTARRVERRRNFAVDTAYSFPIFPRRLNSSLRCTLEPASHALNIPPARPLRRHQWAVQGLVFSLFLYGIVGEVLEALILRSSRTLSSQFNALDLVSVVSEVLHTADSAPRGPDSRLRNFIALRIIVLNIISL